MKNNFWLLCLLLFGSCYILFAQSPDSLHRIMKQSNSMQKSSLQIELSKVYLNSKVDSSYYYARQALLVAQKIKNDTAIAKAHRWLGEWYQNKTRYTESVSEYWKAIKLSRKIKDKSLESAVLNGLGITYYLQQDLTKAEEYIQKAAQLRYEIKDYTYYSVLLTNLSAIYFHNKEYDKAIGLLRKTEKTLVQQPEGAYMASLYNTLGGCYQMAYPEKDSAVYYYTKSIDVAKRFGISQNVMTGYHNLGEDALRKGKYDIALSYLQRALAISTTLGNDTYVMNVQATLAETYRAKGDFKNASKHLQEELDLRKKLFESDKQKTIKEMEFKYETAIKDQQLLEQEELIQSSLLRAEKEKNTRNTILFFTIFLLAVVVFMFLFQVQKRKAKARLEEEKSKIFENIVHDLRTPLTLIKGPLEVLKKEHLATPTAQAFHTIEVQSEQLITLVNELLDASSLEKGKYTPIMKVGNPFLILEKRIEGIQEMVKAKQLSLSVDFPKGEKTLYFPSDVLDKVFTNVLSNAVKFTPEGGVISVNANLNTSDLKIYVFNSGSSFSSAQKERLFERFYRLPEHQGIPGSGIGLSVSKDLLDLVKGTITVESSEEGVTFVFSIPVEVVTQSVPGEQTNEKPLLLLVEDQPEIQLFIRDYLASDFTIIMADNGEVGFALAKEQLPDVIVTDLLMPGMSGMELLTHLKQETLTSHLPVVICSSKHSESSRLEGLAKGASAYVTKPFHPEELRLTLHNLMEQEQLIRKKYEEQKENHLSCQERLASTNAFVQKATEYVFKQMENAEFDVQQLAEYLCISRSQLHRKLTQLTGYSATQFIKMIRLEQAKDYLRDGTLNITEIAYRCGFNSQSYFSKSFQEYTGESPSQFAQRTKNGLNAT